MSIRSSFFAFICILFVPALSGAQTRSIISNLANPAIGFNALFSGQVAPDLDQPYGLRFDEAEISLISTVDPYWTLSSNLVFTPDGVDPEEVYAVTNSIPGIGLKIGKIRGTFGKHGQLHTHAFPFIQAPVILENSIGGEGFKDAGIEASWLTPLPWYCELTLGGYQAAGLDGDHPLDFGSSNHDNIPWLARLKDQFDLDDNTTLEVGASSLTGLGADGLHHAAYGADLTLRNVPLQQSNQRGWIVQGEYLRKVAYGTGVYDREAEGWYGSFQYRWSQNWWSGVRFEEAFHSLTETLAGPPDPSGATSPIPGHVQRASIDIAWLPSEFSTIRAEYSLAKADADDGSGTAWDHRLLLQLNYTIGFHPPHAY